MSRALDSRSRTPRGGNDDGAAAVPGRRGCRGPRRRDHHAQGGDAAPRIARRRWRGGVVDARRSADRRATAASQAWRAPAPARSRSTGPRSPPRRSASKVRAGRCWARGRRPPPARRHPRDPREPRPHRPHPTVAGRLAGSGYSALALDLLSEEGGTGAFPGEAEVAAAALPVPPERFVEDMRASITELKRRVPAQGRRRDRLLLRRRHDLAPARFGRAPAGGGRSLLWPVPDGRQSEGLQGGGAGGVRRSRRPRERHARCGSKPRSRRRA